MRGGGDINILTTHTERLVTPWSKPPKWLSQSSDTDV